MRLVGAGQSYIRAPFMVEGVLYGLIAGIITLVLFYPLTWWLGSATESFFGGINIFSYYLSHFPFFFLWLCRHGGCVGGAGEFSCGAPLLNDLIGWSRNTYLLLEA